MAAKFINRQTSLNDLIDDPKAYGLPTFQEYCKNLDKWRTDRPKTNRLATIDNSTTRHREVLEKQTYKVNGFKFKKLEHAEKAAESMGIDVKRMDFDQVKPQVVPVGGGKMNLEVEITPKKVILTDEE